MRGIITAVIVVSLALILSACHGPMSHKMKGQTKCGSCPKALAAQDMQMAKAGSCCKVNKAGQPVAAETTRADVLYACACGNGCGCNSLSKEPGNCACDKPMRWHHVLKVEQDTALLCTCKEGCSCKLDPNNADKCSCGNPVKKVSLKKSGLFFCNCGGSCLCNTVKDAAGECRCGMPLKQVS